MDLILNLKKSGFKDIGTVGNEIQRFQKGASQYNIRNFSKQGSATAEYLLNKKRRIKICLGD